MKQFLLSAFLYSTIRLTFIDILIKKYEHILNYVIIKDVYNNLVTLLL